MSVSAGHVHTITTRDSVEMRRDGCLDFVRREDALRSSSQGAAIECILTELTTVGNEENLR